jgi:hypothetical protein
MDPAKPGDPFLRTEGLLWDSWFLIWRHVKIIGEIGTNNEET